MQSSGCLSELKLSRDGSKCPQQEARGRAGLRRGLTECPLLLGASWVAWVQSPGPTSQATLGQGEEPRRGAQTRVGHQGAVRGAGQMLCVTRRATRLRQ